MASDWAVPKCWLLSSHICQPKKGPCLTGIFPGQRIPTLNIPFPALVKTWPALSTPSETEPPCSIGVRGWGILPESYSDGVILQLQNCSAGLGGGGSLEEPRTPTWTP